jgi:hypothetical protein
MLNAGLILEKCLETVNRTWDTQYLVIEDNLYNLTAAAHICRIDDLKKTLIGNDQLVLDFGDGASVILTPQGCYIDEAKTQDLN